jgi:hypothetical protein
MSGSKPGDFNISQEGLTALFEWSNLWQLNIAYHKCAVLSIGNIKTNCDFIINSTTIPFLCEVVDLGVTIDNSLNFSLHINNVTKTAFARANLILRCFASKDIYCLSQAFVTYVRPMLEYCSPVWSPSSVKVINQIESVQRIFTKRLFGNNQLSYFDRLVALDWITLETRRLHADLFLCYKIIHRLVSIDFDCIFTLASSVGTRGHKFKLVTQFSKHNVRHNFYSVRVIPLWNDLPSHVVDATSVIIFKQLLKYCDFTSYCKVEIN